jgi:hypothetical protein
VTATKKKPDAFGSMLCAMQAAYEDEIHRLADALRARILAGEFSGSTPPGPVRGDPRDEPRYLVLERELEKTHPWLATLRGRLAVEAASRWIVAREKAMGDCTDGIVYGPGDHAAECMTHDILAVAAARGWVRRMRHINDETYELRVA